ncbi:MAG: ATP-binding cassette domain-containing protein, partial [Candidatus Hermodarchaeota archaeon]
MGEVKVTAIRDFTLEIEAGRFVCLLGPSGSGKTTLLNLISTIDVPTSGKI